MSKPARAQVSGFGLILVEIVDECLGRNMGNINLPGSLGCWLHVSLKLFNVPVFDGSWHIV